MKLKQKLLSILCSVTLLLTTVAAPFDPSLGANAQTAESQTQTQIEGQQAPLLEVFKEPATDWASAALPLGNGFLGAMVFGGIGRDRILINEHSLWSGGPGANADYDGGHSTKTAEQNHQNLQAARAALQEMATEFSENSAAYIDENTGEVVSEDYPNVAGSEIGALRGEKTNFGSYQALGNITLDDPDYINLNNVTTNSLTDTASYGVAKLFDGDPATKWCSISGKNKPYPETLPVWIVAEYERPVSFVEYSLVSGEDMPARDPKDWTLYGSNDGENFDVIDTQSGVVFSTRRQTKTFALEDSVSYRYIKFEITATYGTGEGEQLSELSFSNERTVSSVGYADYINLTTNSAHKQAAYGVEKLFDASTSTKWTAIAGQSRPFNQPFPVWFTTEYASPLVFNSYTLTSGSDADYRDPKAWTLYGSNDGENYDVLDTQSDITFSARKQAKTFPLEEPVSYRFVKFEITDLLGDGTNDITAIGPQLCDISYDNNPVAGSGPDGSYTDYERTLDLDNSIARVSYQQDGVNFTREYWVSNPGNFMAIRLTADQAGAVSKVIGVNTEHTNHTITAEDDTITLTGQPADQNADGLKFVQQIKVIPEGGTMTAEDGRITVQDADSILLLMTAGTNYQMSMDDSFDYFSDEDPLVAVEQRLNDAAAQSYDDLLAAHTEDYQELFSRVKLNLGSTQLPNKTTDALLAGYAGTNTAAEDRYLETLYYQFGRYLLIASSREGSLPANLQGIWADGLNPIWDADYHTNINVEMNYWLAEQTNLSECHEPLIQFINGLVPRGTQTAQLYHCTEDGDPVRGWTAYHEVNIWGNTSPGTSTAFYFPEGAAWLVQHIWEQYAFTQDKEKLQENYDTLLQAALFWVDNLVTDERDGTLVVSPSQSPEHGPYSLGSAGDQAIVWDLFTNTLKASEALGIDTPEVEEIRTALGNLSNPNKIGLGGQFQEWKDEITLDITGDNHYRHIMQLFGLHPGNQIIPGRSEEDDAYAEAMKVALNTRGDSVGNGSVGWSQAWKINFWARLLDGNRAGKLVKEIISQSTQDNLFDSCNGYTPFQIDGNLGATAGMTEMLLQSQGDAIDLLPAVPDNWFQGEVTGLKARGDVEVDMQWQDNALTSAELRPGTDSMLTLHGEKLGGSLLTDSSGDEVSFATVDEDTISFNATAGESYTLTAGSGEGTVLEGEGTKSKPYEIGTEDELRLMARKINGDSENYASKFYVLTDDIELTEDFTPIQSFSGQLDGKGYTVSGLTLDPSLMEAGFIINNTGTIQNLAFDEVDITGIDEFQDTSEEQSWKRGAVAVYNRETIQSCSMEGSLSGGWRVGGIVAENYASIRNCWTAVDVNGNWETGGIAAWTANTGVIDSCYVIPQVYANAKNTGGITGYAYTGTVIQNCAVLNGSIASGQNATSARICGRNNSSPTFQNNIASETLTVQGNPVTDGAADNLNGLSKTDEELTQQETYEALGWDFTDIWNFELGRPVLRVLNTDEVFTDSYTVQSPDGELEAIVYTDKDKKLGYKILYKEEEVILGSRLGLVVDGVNLGENVTLDEPEYTSEDSTYETRGMHTTAVDKYNAMTVPVTEAESGKGMEVEMRAFDDGIAFRYVLPDDTSVSISDENTDYTFPQDAKAFYQVGDTGGYDSITNMQSAYSQSLVSEMPAGRLLCTLPTFELPGKAAYVCLAEANLYDWAGIGLRVQDDKSLKAEYWDDGTYTEAGGLTFSTAHGSSPWRVAIISDDLTEFVNSDIITSVSDPEKTELFPDKSYIKPGRAVWITQGGSGETEEKRQPTPEQAKRYSYYASQLGIEYNLIEKHDAARGWGETLEDQFATIKEVVDYSKPLGVDIWVWRDAPDGLYDPATRAQFLDMCKEAGVVGVKIDHIHSEKPDKVNFYEDFLKDAAKRQIMVSYHNPMKPTGLSRTYPNEITREAIRGMQYTLNPNNTAIFPFTRLLAGGADFTPLNFSNSGKLGEGTWTHMLANTVIMTSAYLQISENPENMVSTKYADFIKKVPAVWDETIVLPQSEIGDNASFLRRSGDDWYLAVQNSTKSTKEMTFDLSFLDDGTYYADIYYDNMRKKADFKRKVETVGKRRISSARSKRSQMRTA